ncbi:4-amino-4-deoxy-L-arabinose transferase [Filimonas lacunae]|uniref:4-amino-4-deoxy-L-arabinose transferase n=1 Tax=Filimonas lacunae TaxID=477680 RepID=A0A173MM36_9BACT|nr:glycosyltransferase family 39 protein [Filimonas lacunae]BAV08530.1 hypothetical protein FLA_4571 [Filimonas lacunae]SIT34087.1 4-amino-4-deoxy-L-arabinose transferase [Filimonas lacunae]
MNILSRSFLLLLVISAIALNATCLLNEIMEPDGALYASISKHMVLTGDWMNLYGNGGDWLDKPHMPFWLAAVSMKLLGITAFAYKLPAFICFVIGSWYVYKLAQALYNNTTALLAVVIYSTSLHVLLSNYDVRAEAYLTAFVIAAIYYLYKAAEANSWLKYILAAAVCSAMAVMTKGIFVLVTIAGGFVCWWLMTKQWKQFIAIKWWLFLVLTLLFLFPELYSLYVQFDMHPEKVVFGHTGVSGIRFFFWDSQFGRFFNNGPIRGKGDPSFFLHTTLWTFLPWSVYLYIAVVQIVRKKNKTVLQRWIISGSALLSFLMFSLSRFQLPHYIVILFPHFAIITADYLCSVTSAKAWKGISIVQFVLLGALVLLIGLLQIVSGLVHVWGWVLIVIALVVVLVWYKQATLKAITGRNFVFAALLFLFLNLFFYPALMHYQGGMEAGQWLQQDKQAYNKAVLYKCYVYSFEFYAPGLVQTALTEDELVSISRKHGYAWVYLIEDNVKELQQRHFKIEVLKRVNDFHISQLTGEFINARKREQVLGHFVLARVAEK